MKQCAVQSERCAGLIAVCSCPLSILHNQKPMLACYSCESNTPFTAASPGSRQEAVWRCLALASPSCGTRFVNL